MCVHYSGWNFCTSWIQLHQTSAAFKRRHRSRWWNVGRGMREERYFWTVMSIEEIAQQMGWNASIEVKGSVKGFLHFLTIPWTGIPSEFSSSLRYEIPPHTSYAMLSPLAIPEVTSAFLTFLFKFYTGMGCTRTWQIAILTENFLPSLQQQWKESYANRKWRPFLQVQVKPGGSVAKACFQLLQ